MEWHRIRVCHNFMHERAPQSATDGSRVIQVAGKPGQAPRYRGVAVCGDAWVCPACAPRITERRRDELRRGVKVHRQQNGQVVLITGTFSHGPMDDLPRAWSGLSDAMRRFNASRAVKAIRAEMGFDGQIRSREITYGVNGWHPHMHALWLVGAHVDDGLLQELERRLSMEWRKFCVRAGLGEPTLKHGFRASLTDVDDYTAKWGLDAELSKWHVKTNAREIDPDAPAEAGLTGYTPFDLLRIAAGDLIPDHRLNLSRDRARMLFADYAEAVKGTAQLYWSKGLKDRLGINPESDEYIAEGLELDVDEVVHGELRGAEWLVLTMTHRQLRFLELVRDVGWNGARLKLDAWCEAYAQRAHAGIQRAFQLAEVSYLCRPP